MNIILITFFVVIMATIIAIARTYSWLAEQRIHELEVPKLTIEHPHHKVETLMQRFMYTDINRDNYGVMFKRDPREKHHFVGSDDHLAHIKHDYTHKLARQMLNGGLVEVQEFEDFGDPVKRVQMTVKVVRPEPDHITYGRL